MALTETEAQLVAALTHNPGYKLLLDAIKAKVDDASDAVLKATAKDDEARLVNYWRALYAIYDTLRETPQRIAESPEATRENPDTAMSPASFAQLAALYGQRLAAAAKPVLPPPSFVSAPPPPVYYQHPLPTQW